MRTGSLQLERRATPRLPRRLLAIATDDRLVEELRRGNEAALEVAYDRHGGRLLSFCRHMLGSLEEAEEAVQHTFAAAWSNLQGDDREVRLKPWLYAVARNRSLSMLRARRPATVELDDDVATAGFSQDVATRSELRELVADVGDLPEEQRAALVLSELGGLSHADIAEVIERKEADVKALVFRARSTLLDWREARDTPCEEVRTQLASLSGGSLRRRWLSRHLQSCAGCREFRAKVKTQRGMLALIIPIAPPLGLKESVLAAAGLGGGSAGGAAVAVGLGGTAAVSATVAKVAAVGALAGGALAVGEAVDRDTERPVREAAPGAQKGPGAAGPIRPGESDRGRSTSARAAPKRKGSARKGSERKDRRAAARQKREGRGESQRRGVAGSPPGTPVRAKGSPPAPGRVRRGLPAPQPGVGTGRGQGSPRRPESPPARSPRQPESPPARSPRQPESPPAGSPVPPRDAPLGDTEPRKLESEKPPKPKAAVTLPQPIQPKG